MSDSWQIREADLVFRVRVDGHYDVVKNRHSACTTKLDLAQVGALVQGLAKIPLERALTILFLPVVP